MERKCINSKVTITTPLSLMPGHALILNLVKSYVISQQVELIEIRREMEMQNLNAPPDWVRSYILVG